MHGREADKQSDAFKIDSVGNSSKLFKQFLYASLKAFSSDVATALTPIAAGYTFHHTSLDDELGASFEDESSSSEFFSIFPSGSVQEKPKKTDETPSDVMSGVERKLASVLSKIQLMAKAASARVEFLEAKCNQVEEASILQTQQIEDLENQLAERKEAARNQTKVQKAVDQLENENAELREKLKSAECYASNGETVKKLTAEVRQLKRWLDEERQERFDSVKPIEEQASMERESMDERQVVSRQDDVPPEELNQKTALEAQMEELNQKILRIEDERNSIAVIANKRLSVFENDIKALIEAEMQHVSQQFAPGVIVSQLMQKLSQVSRARLVEAVSAAPLTDRSVVPRGPSMRSSVSSADVPATARKRVHRPLDTYRT